MKQLELSKRISAWKQSPFDAATQAAVKTLEKDPKAAEDAFYTDLAFGTGGMRGIMGVGTNRINPYTLGRATQGLANYLNEVFPNTNIRVVIAYDCRNNSKRFAQKVAAIFSANNCEVHLFSDLRPTPELSFAVRKLQAHCGIVLTASHNPPAYNGYKVYWQDGGQIVPPHDQRIMDAIAATSYEAIKFKAKSDLIHAIDRSVDEAFWATALKAAAMPQKDKEKLKVVFTPIHGTAREGVPQVLERAGFTQVYTVTQQMKADGNFPTVQSPNPEEPEALQLALDLAKEKNANIVIGTDPDADRLGIAVRDLNGELVVLNGNQTLTIFTYFLLKKWQLEKGFKGNEYIASTIVSSPIVQNMAAHFGVECVVTLTGFKWIAAEIAARPNDRFICGGEESYGFMVGDQVRDKDAITSSLLACEISQWCHNNNTTLYALLLECYQQFGVYQERLISKTKTGSDGKKAIAAQMEAMRAHPPLQFGNHKVIQIADYAKGEAYEPATNTTSLLALPKSNVLIYQLENGGQIALRPSGTEPKIKLYLSTCTAYRKDSTWEAHFDMLNKELDEFQNLLSL